MRLAKYHLDIGVFTNQTEAMLAFWRDEVGLPYEEMLPVGGGVQQHRHGMNGSVFKLNAVRDALAEGAPSGYRELYIARAGLTEHRRLTDPDGNVVTLVPESEGWLPAGIAVRLAVRSEAAFHHFYGDVLELESIGTNAYRCGDTVLLFDEDESAVEAGEMRGTGYRYLTVQVWDVDAEHRQALERGAWEGRAPVTLGTTARISFLRDPDGNWIEISQRASLTGALPQEGTRPEE